MSLFGIGFLPKMPGTYGTAATMPFLILLGLFEAPFFIFLPFLLISTVASCFMAEYAQKKFSVHDPSWIVIDESLGILTAWLFLTGSEILWWQYLLIFVLFRFFDIIKFPLARYFDQKVQHGCGTILDDIVSGIYAGLTYKLIQYFLF